MHNAVFQRILILSLTLTISNCSKLKEAAESASFTKLPDITAINIDVATVDQCPNGGSVMKIYKDSNLNGLFDSNETVISTTPVCNGAQGANGSNGVNGTNGTNGTNGVSAGIEVKTAANGSCPAGGTVINTFQDFNSNGLLDGTEVIVTSSTVCNGVNGTNGTNGTNGVDGRNAIITSSAASVAQCSAGGIVYTTLLDGQAPEANIVCNGVNGSNGINGSNAIFAMGAVGSAIVGKPYSACHHDYVYLPNGQDASKGWLIFRHQKNGSSDQGIGSTGFNLWNVDIADFLLVSEVGGVTYCSLHWNPTTRTLQYNVSSNQDGVAGENGSIQF